jgi:hypothetical protein
VIDLSTENLVSLTEAARLLPPARDGRPVHTSCILRWCLRGARSPAGSRVRLEAVRLGGRWVTSKQAIQRFADRLTPQLGDAPTTTPRTPAARRRASERAEKQLEKLGI